MVRTKNNSTIVGQHFLYFWSCTKNRVNVWGFEIYHKKGKLHDLCKLVDYPEVFYKDSKIAIVEINIEHSKTVLLFGFCALKAKSTDT